jgi:hypothetical protein
MRQPLALVDDLSPLPENQPRAPYAAPFRRPGYWILLGQIVFGIAFWTGAGFGIRALIAVL